MICCTVTKASTSRPVAAEVATMIDPKPIMLRVSAAMTASIVDESWQTVVATL